MRLSLLLLDRERAYMCLYRMVTPFFCLQISARLQAFVTKGQESDQLRMGDLAIAAIFMGQGSLLPGFGFRSTKI